MKQGILKKLRLFLLALIIQIPFTYPYSPHKTAFTFLGSYAFWYFIPTLHQTFSSNSLVKAIGHNPHLSPIPSADTTDKIPVITALGWPDPEGMYTGKFDTPNNFTVTFRFHNTCLLSKSYNPLTYCIGIRSLNFGQTHDAQTLLYVVAECYKQGHSAAHIFANSRGCAAVITLLDILINPENYHSLWQAIGITDPAEQQALRDMVAAGSIYLAHPLLNQFDGIVHSYNRLLQPLKTLSTRLLSAVCWSSAHTAQLLLHAATRYSIFRSAPIKLLKENIIPAQIFNVTIAIAEHDTFVGHLHDKDLYELSVLYPNSFTVEVGGTTHTDIRMLLQRFRTHITTS